MRRAQDLLQLADFLEELATFGAARKFHDAETAHHIAQLIKYRYLVSLAFECRPFSLPALGDSKRPQ